MQPPASPSEANAPLYEEFFGLREQPFALTTDPKFLYMSAGHHRAYDELLTGLRRREGLLLLSGETGTGKTTLCRAVLNTLGPRTFSALVLNPYMSGAEILRSVVRDFGLVTRDEIRNGAFARADVPQLLDTLEGFLRSLIPLNSYAVVVIDEAQSLTPEALDQIRMLGAFEQDGQRLVQIILCGQPNLVATIQSEPLRALNERITRRTALTALPSTEIEAYIRHRLSVAGGRDAVVFESDAIWLLSNLSRGLPRRINVLCDRSLEEGRTDGTNVIGPEVVKRAAKSIAGLLSTTGAAEVRPEPPAAALPAAAAPSVEAPAPAAEPVPVAAAPAVTREVIRAEPAGGTWRRIGLAVLLIVLLALAGGGYYAWQLADYSVGLPAAPARPVVASPPAPIPLPTQDQIQSIVVPPAGGGIGGGSGQLPDDRQQLD